MATNYNEVKQEVIKEMEQRYGLIPGFFSEDKAAGAIFLNKGNYGSSIWMDGEGLFYEDDVPWEDLTISNAVQDGDTPVKLRRHGNWVHISGAIRSVKAQQVLAQITSDIAPYQDSYFAANAFPSSNVNLPVAATVLVTKEGKLSMYLPEATTHYVAFSLSYPIK